MVKRAHAAGLDVIAIADHDTTSGVPEALRAAGDRLRVVPAIEISARHRDRDLHVLGYFVAPAAPAMVEFASRARRGRELRIRDMVDRLHGLGVHVEFDAVVEEAGPSSPTLARPHLARALLAAGHVDSISEAFDRFIGDDGPAYVPTDIVDVTGAIDLIHAAGGLAVWAHPPLPLLGAALRSFVDAGLDGIECYRPRVLPADLNRLLNKARKHGLLVTGGSDWHGEWHGPLGSFTVDSADLDDVFLEGLPRGRTPP